MKLGLVVDGHWGFIRELLSDWQTHYDAEVLAYRDIELPFAQGRINQWRLKRSLKQFVDRHAVTFFEWAGPFTIAASRLPSNKPLIVRLHSWELYEFAPRICWESVSRIVLVSRAMQRKFIALFPAQAAKTSVVNNGVSLDRFPPASREFVGNIGMLGNIVPIKRVYEAILMLHELRKEGYRLHLHLGGEAGKAGEAERYFASIRSTIEKLSLQDQVSFYGWVDDVPSWLRNIDIFVSNSYWEGQQVALIEAMAAGCYSLAHFWDGAEEVLPPEHLYATEAELKTKIIEYCERPEAEKKQLQEQLRAIACRKFDIECTKRRLRAIIDDAVT